jgi:hypothetical protein
LPLTKIINLNEESITKENFYLHDNDNNYRGAFIEVYNQPESMNSDIEFLPLKIIYLLYYDFKDYLRCFAEVSLQKEFKNKLIISYHFKGLLINKKLLGYLSEY